MLHRVGTANANLLLMTQTILVVDDDASVRESVDKVLRGAGYQTLLAAGVSDAIVQFHALPIDLVMLDIGLPNQKGWETCKQVSGAHPNVPMIVIAGQGGPFSSALAAGASAFMVKPLDANEMLKKAQELLAHSRPFMLEPTPSIPNVTVRS